MSDIVFKISAFTSSEIDRVASLHRSGIMKGFLPSLGDKFLRLLYQAISRSDKGILILAIKNGQVIGFVSGAISLRPIYSLLLKENLFELIFILFPKFFYRHNLNKIVDLLLYSSRFCKEKADRSAAELLSIIVDEKYRGQGIAQGLFEQLMFEFQKRKVAEFKIIVGESLTSAQRFYEKMGARKCRKIEVHKGEVSWEYIFNRGPLLIGTKS